MKKINKMKTLLSVALCVFTLMTAIAQNDEQAKKLLDDVSNKMSSYNNVFIEFDYVLNNKSEDVQQKMSGDVLLQGEKYVVNLFGSKQIFDGSRTFTIIPENEEVNISNADIDGGNTFTPSKFYSFYKNGYTFKLGELKKIKGKQVQFVKLIPIDTNSEITSIFVGIDTKYKHIFQIIENGKNGTDTVLTANNIKTDQTFEKDYFSFDEKKYTDLNYIINK
jgi:outer membrane lipoprotein-sorting protein